MEDGAAHRWFMRVPFAGSFVRLFAKAQNKTGNPCVSFVTLVSSVHVLVSEGKILLSKSPDPTMLGDAPEAFELRHALCHLLFNEPLCYRCCFAPPRDAAVQGSTDGFAGLVRRTFLLWVWQLPWILIASSKMSMSQNADPTKPRIPFCFGCTICTLLNSIRLQRDPPHQL